MKGTSSGEKTSLIVLIAIASLVLVVAAFIIQSVGAIFNNLTISEALALLDRNGYVVLASGEYATLQDTMDEILEETRHTSYIWPETTGLTATITAPVGANTWGNWVELTDSAGNKFSDKVTSVTHLSDTKIEEYSDKNHTYMYQIAYGDSKTIVGGRRVSPIKESGEYAIDLKSIPIPIGSKVYVRCMCSTGGGSCTILLRYHYHP